MDCPRCAGCLMQGAYTDESGDIKWETYCVNCGCRPEAMPASTNVRQPHYCSRRDTAV